ncbi:MULTISPECIES: hypothetical protein [unclassified Mycobacterium]|uniref:hypothetical protein n=1 Tax=unclassified Mycobacterium TaxID=2642494 RepID=UPI0029C7C6FF|nr:MULTISPECIES: hypothetical protein [unclassified Mycobacterium]
MTTTTLDDHQDNLEIDGPRIDASEVADKSTKLKHAWRQRNWLRTITYGLLPAFAMMVTMGSAYLKWTDTTIGDARTARTDSVQAARDATVALLSYTPADVDKQLTSARGLLTGDFRNSYTSLTNDVVIPGAKQQQITAVAAVPAAASVSATVDHAVALVFVNQTTTVGSGAPSALASTVRVVLERVNGRWLISQFDPV